jgi:hypothetical protein
MTNVYDAKACIIQEQQKAADAHHWAVSAMRMYRPDTPGWIRQAITEQRVAAIHSKGVRANLTFLIYNT